MRTEVYDFVVVGSGFAGSIMSMVLRRIGKSVLMIERGKHPRFAIGESSTPFANLLLEKIAEDYDLPFLKQLSEWGSWRSNFPDLPIGLKRGFSFFHHDSRKSLDFSDRSKQLLVAASPNDTVADTHWYRPEFDAFLVRKAIETGVDYRDLTEVKFARTEGGEWKLSLFNGDNESPVAGRFLIDASGGGVPSTEFSTVRTGFESMPKTAGVWAHFEGVERLDGMIPSFLDADLPYPPDDAAVHHIFDGGWVWVLRFNNGITSAGVAFTPDAGIEGSTGEEKWNKTLLRLPSLSAQFRGATPITRFYESPQLSFVRSGIAGENWALLPSAAGFVDPLLSTGFALTLLGIVRIAQGQDGGLGQYERVTREELYATADLVSALYAKMNSFEEFSLLTLLYFSVMSYSETLWRLGKSDRAGSLLLTTDQEFSAKRREICKAARNGERVTREQVHRIIQPYDIAGLTDWSRKNWYPVEMRDLFENSSKCGATESDIAALVRRLKI